GQESGTAAFGKVLAMADILWRCLLLQEYLSLHSHARRSATIELHFEDSVRPQNIGAMMPIFLTLFKHVTP
ncbi:hypothetical protein, partial [Sphingomonas sp. PP-CC-1A-547]|uniref:hypothetical protein n=1 Tax=Sphingomonas sp. PP-CC-1A-547 TaxID=2135654 RepID=UPI001C7D7138